MLFSFVVAAVRNGIPIGPKVCMILNIHKIKLIWISRLLQKFDAIFLIQVLNGLIFTQLIDKKIKNLITI